MKNLVSALEVTKKKYSKKQAIVCGQTSYTYDKLCSLSNQVANALTDAGIKSGDKVALSCPNVPYFPIIYFGVLKMGAIIVPIDYNLKKADITSCLKESGAKAYFCFQDTPESSIATEGMTGFKATASCKQFYLITTGLDDSSPLKGVTTLGSFIAGQPEEFVSPTICADDIALLGYTFGSDAQPKCDMLSHSALMNGVAASKKAMGMTQKDVHVIGLSMFNSFSQTCQMNAGIVTGCTLVLLPVFNATTFLKAVQNNGATIFAGTPEIYETLLRYEDAQKQFDLNNIFSNLRICASGISCMENEISSGLKEKYNIDVREGYSLPQSSSIVAFNHFRKENKPGSVGTPVEGVDIRLFDKKNHEVPAGEIGEIVVRGLSLIERYRNNAKPGNKGINEGPWLHTGDLGKKDEDGYIYIVDKVKNVVNRGGFEVYPKQVEKILKRHKAVSRVSVVGVPHDRHGEEIKAIITLKQGKDVTISEFIEWSKANMAFYKHPRVVEIKELSCAITPAMSMKKKLNPMGFPHQHIIDGQTHLPAYAVPVITAPENRPNF